MRHPQTKNLFAYWMELFADANESCGTPRRMPSRNAVEPAAIRNLLGDVFILDGSDDGEVRYRIAGTRVCALHGREMRGEPFADGFGVPNKSDARSWTGTMGTERCLVLLSTVATSRAGEVVALETLLLPLEHEGRTDRRALGITTAADEPEWLGLVPVVAQDLCAARLIRPWESNVFLANYPFALPDTVEAAPGRRNADPLVPHRTVSHLRVFEGGRA